MFIQGFFLGSLLISAVLAKPVAVRMPQAPTYLDSRGLPSLHLGSFDLTTSHLNDTLFTIGSSTPVGQASDAYSLSVSCIDCRTWGSATISTSGVDKKDDILHDIINFFKHPIDAVADAFSLDVKIDFTNVGGHFDFLIEASNTVSYSFPIFESQTPVGVAVSEDVSFGLVLSIDLVFSLTTVVDLEAGFEFEFPEGAFITVDPISGHIVDHSFTGGDVHNVSFPIFSTLVSFL